MFTSVSYKFIGLQVFNLFIASSSSRADSYLFLDQTKHAKSAREVLSLTSLKNLSDFSSLSQIKKVT